MTGSGFQGSLSADRYLRERVDDQLRWYGARSASGKRWHHGLQLATILLAASVPVLALASGDLRMRVAVAVIGALTTVAAGLGSLYGFREDWVDYRSAAEALKHEKYLFLTGAAPYIGAGAFSLFVNRVESIIREERVSWRERNLDEDRFDHTPAAGDKAMEPTGMVESKGPVGVRSRSLSGSVGEVPPGTLRSPACKPSCPSVDTRTFDVKA